jgi:hypothetical protein
MSKSQRNSMSSGQKETHRLVNQALDQLDGDMNLIYAQNSSIVTRWMVHEMTAGEKTFEQAAVHLARNFLIPEDLLELRAVGERIDKDMAEHTVGEDT